MKKVLKVVLAAAAVAAMAVPAVAADKLVVKPPVGSTNANPMVVGDDGKTGFNFNTPRYAADVANADKTVRSQLHFTPDGQDNGGWLTSAGGNNFFISSGAVYDATLGGWIQKDATGKSVFFGSGGAGFRAFLNSGNTVGAVHTTQLQAMLVDYSGNMELGGQLRLNALGTATAAPTCDSTKRGYFWFVAAAAGTKDSVAVCAKDAANAYAWRTLY